MVNCTYDEFYLNKNFNKINVYYFSQFLWVKNLKVNWLGDSDLGSLTSSQDVSWSKSHLKKSRLNST